MKRRRRGGRKSRRDGGGNAGQIIYPSSPPLCDRVLPSCGRDPSAKTPRPNSRPWERDGTPDGPDEISRIVQSAAVFPSPYTFALTYTSGIVMPAREEHTFLPIYQGCAFDGRSEDIRDRKFLFHFTLSYYLSYLPERIGALGPST